MNHGDLTAQFDFAEHLVVEHGVGASTEWLLHVNCGLTESSQYWDAFLIWLTNSVGAVEEIDELDGVAGDGIE